MERKKLKLSFSIIILAASVMLVLSAVIVLILDSLAWFSDKRSPNASGINVEVSDSFPYSSSILGPNSREALLTPGNTVFFEVKVISARADFYVRLDVVPLSDGDFYDFFSKREDLLSGYLKQTTLTTVNGEENFFYNFDIDDYLETLTVPLTDAEKLDGKVEFLRKFAKNNNLLSAVKMTITAINGTGFNIDLVPLEGNETVFGPDKDQVLIYNGNAEGNLLLESGDIVTVAMDYGAAGMVWMPSATVGQNDPVYEPGQYAINSLNCFIGQKVRVFFESAIQ